MFPKIEYTKPEWSIEKASPEYNWIILSTPESAAGKNPKQIMNNPLIGGVFFTPKVYNELLYIFEKMAQKNKESAAFVIIKRLSDVRPHWLAYDFFVPKQKTSGGEVSIDARDCALYFEYLLKNYPEEFKDEKDLHSKLMHAHSHHNMAMCNWSSIDIEQQMTRSELGYQSPYRIYFLHTVSNGMKATLVDYERVTTRSELFIGITFSDQRANVPLVASRKKELDKIIEENIDIGFLNNDTSFSGLEEFIFSGFGSKQPKTQYQPQFQFQPHKPVKTLQAPESVSDAVPSVVSDAVSDVVSEAIEKYITDITPSKKDISYVAQVIDKYLDLSEEQANRLAKAIAVFMRAIDVPAQECTAIVIWIADIDLLINMDTTTEGDLNIYYSNGIIENEVLPEDIENIKNKNYESIINILYNLV